MKPKHWMIYGISLSVAVLLLGAGCSFQNPVKPDTSQSESEPTKPVEPAKPDDQPKEEKDVKSIVLDEAREVVQALSKKDMESLAKYVHADKGLTFSPYSFIQDDAMTFTKEQVQTLSDDKNTYTWGAYDGSGEPIELTFEQYVDKFVYNKDYEAKADIVYNEDIKRGNTIKNTSEKFPESINVEYYVKGSDENGGMDWSSIILIFQQDDEKEWKLVAIVHDQWTI